MRSRPPESCSSAMQFTMRTHGLFVDVFLTALALALASMMNAHRPRHLLQVTCHDSTDFLATLQSLPLHIQRLSEV